MIFNRPNAFLPRAHSRPTKANPFAPRRTRERASALAWGALIVVILFFGSCVLTRMPEQWVMTNRSEAKAGQREVHVALESFEEKYGRFPNSRPLEDAAGSPKLATLLGQAGGMALTTWATEELPLEVLDPFSPKKSFPYVYTSDGDQWILISAAPDREYQSDPNSGEGFSAWTGDSGNFLFYDPSNGMVSSGDMFRTRRGVTVPSSFPLGRSWNTDDAEPDKEDTAPNNSAETQPDAAPNPQSDTNTNP